MGMFDTYKPALKQKCPICGVELNVWQGKDGPCGLFVWSEGVAYPTGQDAGEVNLPVDKIRQFRLPDEFEIYSYDCSCPFAVEAIGRCHNGVWVSTELVHSSNAKQKKSERKEDFKARLRWLKGNAT